MRIPLRNLPPLLTSFTGGLAIPFVDTPPHAWRPSM